MSERQPCCQIKRQGVNLPTAPTLTFLSSVGEMCQKDAGYQVAVKYADMDQGLGV